MKCQVEGINAIVFYPMRDVINYRAACRYIEMLSLFVNVKYYPSPFRLNSLRPMSKTFLSNCNKQQIPPNQHNDNLLP